MIKIILNNKEQEGDFKNILSNKISPNLAYALGVIYGDGFISIEKRGGRIGLKVKDQDFALKFKKELESWSGLKVKFTFKNEFYHVTLYSIKLAKMLKNFKIKNILSLEKNIKYRFLSGLFDSDGGVIGENLNYRKNAKRWIHFSNSNKEIINSVSNLFKEFGLKHSITSRIHSGFGSKKTQYEIKIYNLKGMFYFYKNIKFYIARKQDRLKKVIESYNYFPLSSFNKAKELHSQMGYRKVAEKIGVSPGVVYGWLFKNNQKQILGTGGI